MNFMRYNNSKLLFMKMKRNFKKDTFYSFVD